MNNAPWSKILLFSLLAGAIGFVIGMLCRCHDHGGCRRGGTCEGGAHGHDRAACCERNDLDAHDHAPGSRDRVRAMVKEIEAGGFQGDTTLAIEGGKVFVHREGDRTEVNVTMEKEGEQARE